MIRCKNVQNEKCDSLRQIVNAKIHQNSIGMEDDDDKMQHSTKNVDNHQDTNMLLLDEMFDEINSSEDKMEIENL